MGKKNFPEANRRRSSLAGLHNVNYVEMQTHYRLIKRANKT
jgi:hypothetical protein